MTIRVKPVEYIVTQDGILRRKCQQVLRHHRAAAKKDGVTLDYDAEHLVTLVHLQQTCEYCYTPLGWNAEFDHKMPLARSSRGHCISNLVVVCSNCNRAKGQLSEEEWHFLREWLETIDPRGAADVRRRLLSGGKVYARNKRRKS